MSNSFDKPYNPKDVEEKIYEFWEKSGYFNPDNSPQNSELKSQSFSIVVPPPNITGSLHMGHALNATIQDILIRKKRMEGYKTLWLPGTDHAGIATQNVVEKDLKKQGISRHDLGKEKFLEKIWEWKEKYGHIILNQFKKLGASMDWSRTRFTMDPDYQEAVKKVFLHYHEKGWMYKAERIVNWCSRCATSLSDLELEYKEVESSLYYIKYPIKSDPKLRIHPNDPNEPEYITVATTRPETMLGDSAVAVNPKDEKYKSLVGKTLILPIMEREIPIVSDFLIDASFGTGAVKVTPAHDFTDAEIGERNKLEIHKIIGQNGRMTSEAGAICDGLKISECREKVIEELQKLNLIEKIEPYKHNVAVCYRCDTVIEPLPSLQWFLKMGELAKMAIDEVKSGRVKFHPQKWEGVYLNWLENVKDWCVSRQIWWGHKVPLLKCASCDEFLIEPKIKSHWFIIRHGETDWNKEQRWMGHEEIPLNETGRKQAKEAAGQLKGKNIDLIISSDLARCKETAEIIAEELKAELIFDTALRERHGGIAQGTTKDERITKLGEHLVNALGTYEGKPEGGESWQDLEKRVLESFNRHKSDHKHKNVIIVSHGGSIRMLKKNINNLSFEDAKQNVPKNTEITELLISEEKCKKCDSDILTPENDVLDTWFSSALWPFATLGWPDSKDFKDFYPTQVLSTARDIINLWVARMIFSGVEFTGKQPFSDVIIHATILTKDGKRMSKSLGTGIDPMTLIEKYGADATRFGLIWQAMGGQDIHWAEEHVMAGKKFCNKIWNATRFVLQQIKDIKIQNT